jgi:hypothetical protein
MARQLKKRNIVISVFNGNWLLDFNISSREARHKIESLETVEKALANSNQDRSVGGANP